MTAKRTQAFATGSATAPAEAPVPEGMVRHTITIPKVIVTNTGKAPITLQTGGTIPPKGKMTIGLSAFRENQPWINGQTITTENTFEQKSWFKPAPREEEDE